MGMKGIKKVQVEFLEQAIKHVCEGGDLQHLKIKTASGRTWEFTGPKPIKAAKK